MSSDDFFHEGALVSSGGFHLDHARATAKLREFQLPSPYHYCLELVKAAHLFGASAIDFHLHTRQVEVFFDATGPTFEELTDLYSRAFDRREDSHQRGLRHLAIALNSAWVLGLQEVLIICSTDDIPPFGVRLRDDGIDPLSRDVLSSEQTESKAKVPGSNGVYIKLVKTAHPRRLLRFASRVTGVGELPEARLLAEKCRYSRIRVGVDGEEVSADLFALNQTPGDSPFNTVFEHDGEVGFVSLKAPKDPKERALQKTRVYYCSVLLNTYESPSALLDHAIEAIVDSPYLNANISQTEVITDRRWEEMQSRIRSSALELRERYFSARLESKDFSEPQELRRQIIETLALAIENGSDALLLDALVKTTKKIPVFERAYPDTLNPGALLFTLEEAAATGLLRFTQVYHRADALEPDSQILWLSRHDCLIPGQPETYDVHNILSLYADALQDLSILHSKGESLTPRKRVRSRTVKKPEPRRETILPKVQPRPDDTEESQPREDAPRRAFLESGQNYTPGQEALLELLFAECGAEMLRFLERFEFHFFDGPGNRAVEVQMRISGHRAKIDITHEVFQDYWAHPDDPAARALAVIPIFSAFNAYRLHDSAESRRSTYREKRHFLRRILKRATSEPPAQRQRYIEG